ncbi:MAG: hypothetical protein VYE21_09105 [Pseudomonadota bacterium]|nr:hypothetical protein [Pseudomonadota bacterium]
MANVKITELAQETNPASDDVLPIVDVDAASGGGETKKVTIADLLENAGDGSAAGAAFGFDADPDTGMYRTGTNALGFTTGGTGRLFIDSSGNVGIGTSSPQVQLHCTNDIRFGNAVTLSRSLSTGLVTFTDATAEPYTQGLAFRNNETNEAYRFQNGDGTTTYMTIRGGGRVGIGTSVPSADLDIFNTGFVNLKVRTSGTNAATLNLTNSTRNYAINSSGGALTFYDATASSERMRIDSSGNLGIGTTDVLGNKVFIDGGNVRIDGAPSTDAVLQIRGDNSTSSSTDAVLSFVSYANNQSGGSNADIRVTNAGSGFGQMAFATRRGGGANTEAMRIDSSGRLLLGSSTALTSPTGSRFQVSGTDFATSSIRQTRYQSDIPGASLILSHARGTEASPTILNNGDEVGKIRWNAHDGTDFECVCAEIKTQIDGTIQENQSPSRLMFSTTASGASLPTERMRITSTGQMRLAGAGITFNGDTATANELDDYEEGTFTPVLLFGSNTTGITYNARAGFYVKIGKVVHAWVYINLSSKGSATGAAAISQFPFTSEDINVSGLVNWPGAQPSRRQNQTSSNLALTMVDNSINCAITDGAGSNVTDATFTNGTILEFALCYRAA